MSDLKLDVIGHLDAKKRIEILKLPANKRRQLLGGFGRELRRSANRNLKAQKDVEGKSWTPRKRGSDRKLLRRLGRQLASNVVTGEYVDVSFKGAVAFQQHEGFTKVMTASATEREQKGREHYNEHATKKQAKGLRDEGYKIRIKGTKKWRKPSLKWIQENLTQKKAGLVLAHLRNIERKKSWVTKIPARHFLGATEQDIKNFVNRVYDNTINSRA